MSKRLFLLLPAIILVISSFSFSIVSADGETPVTDDQINAVASQLYCPVCENIPLDVCPTSACAQWRNLIGEKISQGWNTEQIKDYFVTQYGDRVLAEPPRRGINWLVYILPPVFILASGIFLVTVIRKLRKPIVTQTFNATGQKQNDPFFAEIEAELKQRKGSS